jgi:hypothetical protein
MISTIYQAKVSCQRSSTEAGGFAPLVRHDFILVYPPKSFRGSNPSTPCGFPGMASKMLQGFPHDASNKIQEDIDSRRSPAIDTNREARSRYSRHRGFLRVRRCRSGFDCFLRRVIGNHCLEVMQV